METTIGDVLAWCESRYPAATAESWDRVGLVCGETDAQVRSVLLSVDVTSAVAQDAVDAGVSLIIAHHPLLLRGIHAVLPSDPKGKMLTTLIRNGIGCFAAHTNADVATDGVCEALAYAIGLQELTPLEPRVEELDQLVTFVPAEQLTAVIDACAAAGAGAIGEYDRCYFTHPGTGSFRPSAAANPFAGTRGEISEVAEQRLEMALPRGKRAKVVTALLAAHPYETPAYHLIEAAPQPGEIGLGRIGTLAEPMSAAVFAQRIADALPATASGVRLGGDPERTLTRVAVLAGAGDSHLDTARRAGVDAYLTCDLRHHPATELLERDDAPVLLDVSHWAAEWTWLPRLQAQLREAFPDLDVVVSTRNTDAWAAAYHRSTGD